MIFKMPKLIQIAGIPDSGFISFFKMVKSPGDVELKVKAKVKGEGEGEPACLTNHFRKRE
jgi:hypothetical protein